MRKIIPGNLRLLAIFLMAGTINAHEVQVFGGQEALGSSDKASLSYQEKVQIWQALKDIRVLIENKLQEGSRAPRWDAPCPGTPVPPPQSIDTALLEEIKCIVCVIKERLGEIDHAKYWECLISAIECGTDMGLEVPVNFGQAVDLLAEALCNVLIRIGCPESCVEKPIEFPMDILGRLCYIRWMLESLDSKIDVVISLVESVGSQLEQCCETIQSKVDSVGDHVNNNTTLIESVGNQVEQCCEDLASRIDSVGDEIKNINVSCNTGVVETLVESVGTQLEECCTDLSSRIDSVGDEIKNINVSCNTGVVETLVESVGTQLEECCTDLSSRIDSVGDDIKNISCNTGVVETLVESVGSQLEECCDELTIGQDETISKVESVGSQVTGLQETADSILAQVDSIELKIGEPDQSIPAPLLCESITLDEINASQYSVIQWLKAIYAQLNRTV